MMDTRLCVRGRVGLLSLLLILFAPVAFSGPPPEINLQGTLESSSGDPVTGAHEFLVGFFDTPTGGAAIVEVTGTAELSNAGRYSIAIPVEPALLASPELWYELAVDTGDDGLDAGDVFPERVKIHSVPFALLARDTELLAGTPAEVYSTDGELETALEEKAPLDHVHDHLYWSLSGNVFAVTEPAVLGSLNDAPVYFIARSDPALRLEPSSGTTNIVGGFPGNLVSQGASGGTVGGGGTEGEQNSVIDSFGTIGGGSGNGAGDWATVAGGRANSAPGSFSFIGGGWSNITDREYCAVGGGVGNVASASCATVPGGCWNLALGDYSLAAGRRARAYHAGCFVWGDSVDADVTSTAQDQFVARANGGVSFFTGAGGLRLNANDISPNFTAGFNDNLISSEVVGAAISGGGTNGAENRVTDNYGAIGGGKGNLVGDATGTNIDASHATVGGGRDNTASGMYAVVGGGWDNLANAFCATIGGGGPADVNDPLNTNNVVFDTYGTIGGGAANRIGSDDGDLYNSRAATIAGGVNNHAAGELSTVGGGYGNLTGGWLSTVAGGMNNSATGDFSTVAGGIDNDATAEIATVGGGSGNLAGETATVSGGVGNLATGYGSFIGGGTNNKATTFFGTIPGGARNEAKGYASFAAGYWAKANHNGAFVWGDSQNVEVVSTAADQVTFRCQGGVRFLSGSSGTNQQVSWAPGNSSWTFSSDRNLKEDFKPVDGQQVLRKVVALPVEEWNFKGHDLRHIGPTAQDFHAAFGLGGRETMIDGGDLHGVTLAAIQGLHEMVKERDAKIAEQHKLIEKLNAKSQEIEARLNWLESRLASTAAEESGRTK